MRQLRVGNCSGFYGDRLSAMREMLEGGELDVLTGDYLAELTMLILGRDQLKDPALGYARTFMRQLEGTIERRHEDKLMEVIARFDGRPFPTTPGLAAQWLNGRLRRSSSLETIYCAELVATTYQAMGLLPSRRPASWYDPGRFWSGDRIALVPPFALAEEVAVR